MEKNPREKHEDGIQKHMSHTPFKLQTQNTKVAVKFWFKLILNFLWKQYLYCLPLSIFWAKIRISYMSKMNTNVIWRVVIKILPSKCYGYANISYSIYLRTNFK